jgi:hypothetical protein
MFGPAEKNGILKLIIGERACRRVSAATVENRSLNFATKKASPPHTNTRRVYFDFFKRLPGWGATQAST